MANDNFDFDYVIIGSGFGGSVSALRLVEKGWRVGLFEQGRRVNEEDFLEGKKKLSKLMWNPALGMKGYFHQFFFRHVSIVAGVGFGGGSIVWGAVMLEPKPKFYDDPILKELKLDLKRELKPHFATVKKMLGVADNPRFSEQDTLLEATAEAMGKAGTYGTVPSAVTFKLPKKKGAAEQSECVFCAGCLTGCPTHSKNALYLNYLAEAEKKGLQVFTDSTVTEIKPLPGEGYSVTVNGKHFTAGKVVLAAGVVGTHRLLFNNKFDGNLPGVSAELGKVVRTNSEAITAVLHPKGTDLSDGLSISSHFYPDENTHVTQNRIDSGYNFMRFFAGPLVDGHNRFLRALKTLLAVLLKPWVLFSNLFARDWVKRITLFTVMQDLDNRVTFFYGRPWWWPFKKRLLTRAYPGHEAPSYLPVANEVTRRYAKLCGGIPMNTILESAAGVSTTAHILSGCNMGETSRDSVIAVDHEVHNYPGLYVVDGSSIPANIGVNPSLTIAAMAERFAALQPGKRKSRPAAKKKAAKKAAKKKAARKAPKKKAGKSKSK